MKRHRVLVLILVAAAASLSGCSPERSSTSVRTERYDDAHRYDDDSRASYGDHERTTTTRTEESKAEDRDSGGLFNILGDIVALPFRALGAIF